MIDFLFQIWSLLPIPIGVFCLFMAAYVYSENDPSEDQDTKSLEHLTKHEPDHELSEHFGKEGEALPKQRSLYFSMLFSGLGFGSILVGMEMFGIYYALAGKFVFFATILTSILIPVLIYKKEKKSEVAKPEKTEN